MGFRGVKEPIEVTRDLIQAIIGDLAPLTSAPYGSETFGD